MIFNKNGDFVGNVQFESERNKDIAKGKFALFKKRSYQKSIEKLDSADKPVDKDKEEEPNPLISKGQSELFGGE